MHVEVPYVLPAARLVVLPHRGSLTSVGLLYSASQPLRRSVDGGQQVVIDLVHVLDVRIRDNNHVSRRGIPPFRADQRRGLAVTKNDISLCIAPLSRPATTAQKGHS